MQKIMRVVFLTTVCVAWSTSSSAAQETKPFGFSIGMSERQIIEVLNARGIDVRRHSQYLIRSEGAISPLTGYSAYELLHTPMTGLCKVTALSNDFETEAAVKNEISRLKVLITKKYGKPSSDGIIDLRPYTGQSNFLNALHSSNYFISVMWGVSAKQRADKSFQRYYIPLPSSTVAAIRLGVRATPGGASVELSYGFKNEQKCEDIISNVNVKAL